MIELVSRDLCTGCEACYNVCGHGAITMEPDKEGFKFPVINSSLCTECTLCQKKCPELNAPKLERKENPKAYAVWSFEDRDKSSSGGAFSIFAKYTLSKGGVVFGAAFDKEFNLHHVEVTKVQDFAPLRGSKYVQSNIGDTFRLVKGYLKEGKPVLFSGTPCQIAGLYSVVGNRFDDLLITLDIVCHGVPSLGIFQNYLSKLRTYEGYKEFDNFSFRKLDGWAKLSTVGVKNKQIKINSRQDIYMAGFDKGLLMRECCYSCRYTKIPRVGTFTLADFWGVGHDKPPFKYSTKEGVSLVLANTDNASHLLQVLSENIFCESRPLSEAVRGNTHLREPSKRPKRRDTAAVDFMDENLTLDELGNKYELLQSKNIRYYVLSIAYRFGVFNQLKEIYNRFKRI